MNNAFHFLVCYFYLWFQHLIVNSQLIFVNFVCPLTGHDDCIFDYVEIFQKDTNESNRQGKYCGSEPPASRTLPGPVTVRFITDYIFTAHGFKLHYEILSTTNFLLQIKNIRSILLIISICDTLSISLIISYFNA